MSQRKDCSPTTRKNTRMAAQPEHRTADSPKAARRQERAQRILDTAAGLILRWGYNKTTIDDIAREAGVAKGTIYLHWNTREELFGALMKRERAAMAADILQHIASDPPAATLHGLLKYSALALMRRPLMKAVLVRDLDVIGKLAHRAQGDAAHVERLAGFTTYLEFLREHHLVRTDLDLRAQVYLISAIFMGFFTVGPLMPQEWRLADEQVADLLAETVRCTLEWGRAATPEDAFGAALSFQRYLDHAAALAAEQFQNEVDGKDEQL